MILSSSFVCTDTILIIIISFWFYYIYSSTSNHIEWMDEWTDDALYINNHQFQGWTCIHTDMCFQACATICVHVHARARVCVHVSVACTLREKEEDI